MIRKRNKIESESNVNVDTNNEASVSCETNNESNESRIIKTYTDLSILALEELEKQGIDIYAEGRFGGMYLHQNKNKELDQKLFDTNKQYILNKPINKASEQDDNTDEDLINFFQK